MRKIFPHRLEVIQVLSSLDHEAASDRIIANLLKSLNKWIQDNIPDPTNQDLWTDSDWNLLYNYLVSIGQIKLENIWMAVRKGGEGRWQNCEQTLLENVSWKEAVYIAKSQPHPTRLSVTIGFNNQGHYFHPETF